MRPPPDQSRPVGIYLLVAFLLFQGASGLWGGSNLVVDPSGQTLRIPLAWLEGSPFSSYLLPGLMLLIALGFFPSFVAYGLVRRTSWSWYGALLVGIALVIWIAVQIVIIGYHPDPPLQFIYGSVGMVILILAFLPSVRRYGRRRPQNSSRSEKSVLS